LIAIVAGLPWRGERTLTMMHDDPLDYLEVVVPPAFSCDEFEVSAALVLECQDFVARGCPGVPYEEEAALYYASLMDHRSLVELRSAWEHADDEARAHGEHAALRRFLQETVAHSASLALAEPIPPR
jgi:hypothetical protein